MAEYKALKGRVVALESRLATLKGSTSILREQYEKAVLELETSYGISQDQVEEEMSKVEAEILSLEKKLVAKLDQFESLN